jgi:hypothetical protein
MSVRASKGSRSRVSVTMLPSPVMQSSEEQDIDTKIIRIARDAIVNDFKMILFN